MLGQHELSVLIAVALVIAGLWLSIELADGVVDGDTQQADESLIMTLREDGEPDNPIGPPMLGQELVGEIEAGARMCPKSF